MKKLVLLIFLFTFGASAQRFVGTYPTIDALLSSPPPGAQTNAIVLGRNVATDQGGGEFYYDKSSSASTNLGTIFQPTSFNGRWIRVWDNANAKVDWFGGFPDDSTDDITAIDDAVNLIHSLRRGNVLFGPGMYDISSTIYVKYRVSLLGVAGWRYTELGSSNPTNQLYLLGGSTHIRLLSGSNADMVVLNSTDGYIRQVNEVVEDGSIGDALFQETAIENIVFYGNVFGNTSGNGIVARQKWNITIRNCGFIYIPDRPILFWDVNGGVVEKVWMKGSIGNQRSRGALIYGSADCLFNDITAFGFCGPAIWVNGASSAVSHYSNLLLGNSVVTNTSYTVSSVSSGQWTLASSTWLETGDMVELRTTGTLPTGAGWSDETTYFATKISAGVYGLHTEYSKATNGLYLTTTSSGTGTHSITIGPASALYLSGTPTGNSFVNVRADQCSGPGITLRNARNNTFLGGMTSQNTGTNNAETVDISEQVGFRFDKGALGNSVVGMSHNYEPYGFQTRLSAANNIINGTYYVIGVSNIVYTGTNPSNRELLEKNEEGETVLGYDTTQTALALTGNNAGVRVLTLDRPSLPQKVGLGVALEGFNFWNETRGISVGQFWADTNATVLQLGTSSATPRQSEVLAEAGSGTDVNGASLLLNGGIGTGHANVSGGIFFYTSDPGSSGTALQTRTLKVAIPKEGQLSLRKQFTADPVNSPQVGDIWYRSDIDRFRGKRNSRVDNFATEEYATLTNVGIGGTFYFTNAAPQLNVDASNGSSGFRVNVTGGSTSGGIIRFQTNNVTTHAFFGDGSMTLYGSGSEPVNYDDGKIWYRTDLDKFRGRANATVENFATEAWVTANFSGGSSVTITGTPTSGQIAEWTSATAIQGVTATGSGSPVKATAPTLPSTVTIGAAGGTTGAALFKGTTSGTVTLSVADAAGTYTAKLPTADGLTNQLIGYSVAGQWIWNDTDGSGLIPRASGSAVQFWDITDSDIINANLTAPDADELKFIAGTGGTITLTSPASGITTHTLRLPAAQGGADQLVKNDGSGQLGYVSPYNIGVAETTVASATTTDLGAVASDKVSITGTTTITGFGTVAAGTKREGRFTGALTLTHNATSLIVPGGASLTTAAGDRFQAYSLGSGNWVVSSYTKADGTAVVGGSGSVATDTIWDASGDLVVGTGANTAARLAPPTQLSGSTLYYGPSGVEWVNPATHFIWREDFLAAAMSTEWTTLNSGGGGGQQASEAGAIGQQYIGITALNSYRHLAKSGVITFAFGLGRTVVTWRLKTPTASNGTDRYTVYAGVYDHQTTPVDGVWIEGVDNVNSGNWQIKFANNSSTTTYNTSTAVGTGWTTFTADCNAGATEVKCYLNGALVHTETGSNIPPSTRGSEIRIGAVKNLGGNYVQFQIDYVDVYVKY